MLHVVVPQRAVCPESVPRAVASLLSYTSAVPVHIVLAWNGQGATERPYPTWIEEEATRMGWRFTLVRVEIPGKPGALNAADAAIDAGPEGGRGSRAYLDADVGLSPCFASRLAAALEGESGARLVVAPAVHERFFSPVCRSFFRVWRSLPYTKQWCPGNGFYAVSEAGRRRWGQFPDVHSDDTIVRLQFEPDELIVLPDSYTLLQPPASAWSLMRARARWSRGSRLAHRLMGPVARRSVANRWRGIAGMVAKRPSLLIDLPVCAVVMAGSWAMTQVSSSTGRSGTWAATPTGVEG